MRTFLALFDLHYGQEIQNGKSVPLHDARALSAVLEFARDLRPDLVVLGGDTLDCSPVSPHLKGNYRGSEGLRLLADMEGFRRDVLTPLEALGPSSCVYHIGNHEDWIDQLVNENAGLEGLIGIKQGLKLNGTWQVVPRGGISRIGKLHFAHGDQIKSTVHPAKWAVEAYERSIRFGHFHRAQLYTKMSALDASDVRTGLAVPGLCRRDPNYLKGSANRWSLGFLWGYVLPDGNFSDYLTMVINDRFVANGRLYKG